ncbi:hypothetical protein ACR1PO_03275 [Chryseobacterium sp. RRHN12]|uniref:hypothetical protein n=1 Tax=Chryseobacterium sp. RRHN12 TaxID=3437884 RepID=UPI003D9BF593
MKKVFYSTAFFACSWVFSQVGVNTVSPQGTFHIDGAKDNPAEGSPTAEQQANDFVVKPNGNVGIGTTTPQTRLDITTAPNSHGLQHTDGTIRLQTFLGKGNTNGNTDAGWIGTYGAHPLDFMTDNAFRVRITTEGNMGVGTFNPAEKLHVAGKVKIDNLPPAAGNDRSVYVGVDGVLKVLPNSTARRSLWGVIKIANEAGEKIVTVENAGSGGWTARYVAEGTVIITATTPFASVPSVEITQYLTSSNSITHSTTPFDQANTRDNSGVDAATRNQFQVWVCDSGGYRVDDGRSVGFVIVGY